MQTEEYTSWLEIDLGAIKNNIRQLTEIACVPVMAVVKANGYGHGLMETAAAAAQAGAAWCGVARIDEALALRQGGLKLPVLVMGFTPTSRVAEAVEYGISLTVYDLDYAREYAQQARACHGMLKVHVKVDTGMGRLGLFPETGLDFTAGLVKLPGLEFEGIFTHMARADETDPQTTIWQIDRFQTLVDQLHGCGLRPRWVHAANSASTLYFPKARFDLVRCGISIYGLHPSIETPNPEPFRPALTWKARLTSVKFLPAGHGIGYNHRYITQKQERIGVVSVGYADGFRRRLGNFVLVRGKRVNVVGGVCMDQCMVQLDGIPEAQIGDEVVLLGKQGNAMISAEEIGSAWGTINYEVVCGLANRLQRVYYES